MLRSIICLAVCLLSFQVEAIVEIASPAAAVLKRVDAGVSFEKNVESWDRYTLTCGDRVAEVNLPKKPMINASNHVTHYFSEDENGCVYGVIAVNQPIYIPDTDIFFGLVQEQMKSEKWVIQQVFIYEKDGHTLMDVVAYDKKHHVIIKLRVGVCGLAMYELTTAYYPGVADQHSYFVDSFKLK